MDVVRMTVEDSFEIEGRGVILAPVWSYTAFDGSARSVEATLISPSGDTRTCEAQLELSHSRLTGGGSEWNWALVLPAGYLKPSPGTVVEFSP